MNLAPFSDGYSLVGVESRIAGTNMLLMIFRAGVLALMHGKPDYSRDMEVDTPIS